jgi:hypothetical protein
MSVSLIVSLLVLAPLVDNWREILGAPLVEEEAMNTICMAFLE